uniref:(northern house mosquito) hypothetical protein n=1 Tax=Culex pipiens TaxID=7175 RepID=A0A8D8J3F1_CULPI
MVPRRAPVQVPARVRAAHAQGVLLHGHQRGAQRQRWQLLRRQSHLPGDRRRHHVRRDPDQPDWPDRLSVLQGDRTHGADPGPEVEPVRRSDDRVGVGRLHDQDLEGAGGWADG